MAPGLYEVHVLPWRFCDYQRLPAAPTFALDVLLPPPVRYRITVVDAATEAHLEGAACWVSSGDARNADLLRRSASWSGRADASDNPFEITKLDGLLSVRVLHPQGTFIPRTVDGTGRTSVEVSVDTPRRVALALTVAGEAYLRPEHWWSIRVESIAPHEGALTAIDHPVPGWASEVGLIFSKSGLYRVRLPPLDHGVIVPALEVLVGEGTDRRVVDLTEWVVLPGAVPREH
jgi:hypothetical protein